MRHTYLVTTAAAALLAGTMFAAAQGMQKQAPDGVGAGQGQMQRELGEQPKGKEQLPGQKGKQQSQKEQGKPSTTGQGAGEQREQGKSEQREQGKGEQGKQGQTKEKGKTEAQKEQGKTPTTTGQMPSKEQPRQGQAKEGQRPEGQQGQTRPEGQQGQTRPEGQAGQTRSGASGSVTLTTEQRTKVRETVLVKGPRANNVNFSINIGTEVPRTVRVVEVDPILIEYYPTWRGHFYFVVGDQIIIVDRNHRIVAVIDV